jgi:ribonuclease VapC
VIFVDASAIVAILTREPDALDLVGRLEAQSERRTSAMAVYEAALAVARKRNTPPAQALDVVLRFLHTYSIVQVEVGAREGTVAIDTFVRFGKGRHPAKLNMGDCFSYACARTLGATLLFKGDDFGQTDIEGA